MSKFNRTMIASAAALVVSVAMSAGASAREKVADPAAPAAVPAADLLARDAGPSVSGGIEARYYARTKSYCLRAVSQQGSDRLRRPYGFRECHSADWWAGQGISIARR